MEGVKEKWPATPLESDKTLSPEHERHNTIAWAEHQMRLRLFLGEGASVK